MEQQPDPLCTVSPFAEQGPAAEYLKVSNQMQMPIDYTPGPSVTPRTHSPESLRCAGYAVLRGDADWIESVIQKAIETDTGIYHASWLVDPNPNAQCFCTPCMRQRGALSY